MSDDKMLPLTFDGSNWENLDRIVALCSFRFTRDDTYNDNPRGRCGLLAEHFRGPALDWAVNVMNTSPASMDNFPGYVVACKQAFGVEANGITALRRNHLEALRYGRDVPVFFAEFDRLTLQLGITDHGTKIVMVRSKLPQSVLKLLAEQALDFANYETMRERLITMWALDPGQRPGEATSSHSTSRCGNCGKKGHKAPDCRGPKK